MPLGLIFSILLFVVLAVVFLAGIPSPDGGLGLIKVLVGASLPLIAVGLILRRPWARWLGLIAGLVLAWIGFVLANSFGQNVADILIFFSGLLLAILFMIPATGDPRRGLEDVELRTSHTGLIAGCLAAVLLAGGSGMFAQVIIGSSTTTPRRTAPGEPGLSQVAWNDFATGLEMAASEGKPMLVDFYAVWCGPCKTMDQVTFRNPEVVAGLQDVIPVRIDAEGTEPVRGLVGEELAQKYKVATYPTLALIDDRGKVISRSRGAMPPAKFLAWLEGALANHRRNPDAEEEQPDELVM
ncbi:MAG: thioredoxin fold domain-containing protein [Acidobacteria bacterium]|uniref:Thioredoxin fold domain-containing protein n=1 Tax=Candidatus Polarisedimenticola svalbardensis TaxID=2886004 RepID=A0A8J6Y8S2_9BACT|nr:thioredoxin fold domain-containing protein [Candidatus Polarisedimenticola svalbardensis]